MVVKAPALDGKRSALYWFYGGVVFTTFVLMTTVSLWHFFGLAFWQPIVAIIISAPLSYLCVRLVVVDANMLMCVQLLG